MAASRIGVRTKLRRPSRLAWAGATVAPWLAALGMVVSFAADAGQDVRLDASQSFRLAAGSRPDALVSESATSGFGFRLGRGDPAVREARLIVGDPADYRDDPEEIDPKPTLKLRGAVFPSVDRSHKGDPSVGLRPTFDARLRRPGSLTAATQALLAFAGPAAVEGGFEGAGQPVPALEEVARFTPLPAGDALTTGPTSSAASPRQGRGATTPHAQDGSSPAIARAARLASSTPVAGDATPVEVAALPKFSRGPHGLVTGNRTVVGVRPALPDYAALIDAAKADSEQKCLATAIYFEARSEPEEGQAAVAQVILNRVGSGLYPSSVCGVVFQNRQRHNACQFSFACEGRALRVGDAASWDRAVRVAREVTDGSAYVSDVGDATHYHAAYVRPLWAGRLRKMDRIGHHIFYKLKPGQT